MQVMNVYFEIHLPTMKTVLALLCISALSTTFTQSETDTQKSIAVTFERKYNNGSYDSAFTMFSSEMQKA